MNKRDIRLLASDEEIPYRLLLLADETKEAIDKYIHDCDIFIYQANLSLIGIYALQEISLEEIEIKNVAVDERYQSKGIGKFLLRDAIGRANNRNYKMITIGTGDASIKQLYLYQKVGFEIYEIKKNFFLENYPEPIYENGIQLKHMIKLRMNLNLI